MGIYDRDYYREPARPKLAIRAPRSIVGALILINVAVYVLDAFSPAQYAPPPLGQRAVVGRWLSDHLAVHVDTLKKPWLWWQMLSYGFTHSPLQFAHILLNMLVLWFLGRDVELKYGRGEFLRLYLVMVVFAALVWCVINNLRGDVSPRQGAYGASGAIAGVVVLFALNFPRRTLLLFFVVPVPAWLAGVMVVALDIFGAMGRGGEDNVAYTMHLAGAALAFVYYRQQWKFTWLSLRRFKRRPRLRIHDPVEEEAVLGAEVDRILEKIHRSGEASLTRKERRTLETASRQYKQRRSQ